jgi:hypothetical protein
MDGSKEHPRLTAGLDLAEKYSYPSASSTKRMARWWRKVSALRTTPEAVRRRFACEQSLPIATRGRYPLALGKQGARGVRPRGVGGQCARKLRLIYANKRKTDEIDASRIWLAWHALIRSFCTHSNIGAKRARLIWP